MVSCRCGGRGPVGRAVSEFVFINDYAWFVAHETTPLAATQTDLEMFFRHAWQLGFEPLIVGLEARGRQRLLRWSLTASSH